MNTSKIRAMLEQLYPECFKRKVARTRHYRLPDFRLRTLGPEYVVASRDGASLRLLLHTWPDPLADRGGEQTVVVHLHLAEKWPQAVRWLDELAAAVARCREYAAAHQP